MGTKVQIENYLPGHYSMRDLSRESNGASWPSCYGDGNLPNGQFYYGFMQRTVAESHPGYDKDAVKQTMLEHEAVFKDQVYELHRLYRVQRDLMDEARRKEEFKRRIPYEASSSSSPVPLQMQSEDVQRWNGVSLPLGNSVCGRPLISVPDAVQSSPHSAKGKSIQTSPSPFQNCYSPKNSEVSESRPTKYRRRMLDLRLPADEYIDTDEVEQFADAKDVDIMSPSPYKNGISTYANGKMVLTHPGKTVCQGDTSKSDLYTSKPKALADLNEPLHVEETTISSVDFLGRAGNHSDFQCRDLPTRLSSESQDVSQNPKNGSLNGTLNHLNENRTNGRDWFGYALESEQYKGSMRSINQGIPPETVSLPSSQSVQVLLDQACRPPAFLTSGNIKGDTWKEKPGCNIEKSDRSYSLSSYNIPEPFLASQVPNQPGLFHPSDLSKSWDQSSSHWGKPSSFMSHKLLSVQASPYYSSANLSKSSQSSAQSNDLYGNKWNLNSTPGASSAFGCEPLMRNGFNQGSSAAFKEAPVRFPPVGVEHVNCSYSERTVLGPSNNYFKGTICTDVKREMNLNVALPNGVSDDRTSTPGLKIIDKDHKSADPLSVLPWLRGKGDCSNEAENLKRGMNSLEPVPNRGLSVTSSSCEVDINAKKPEISKKILGVPIFENPVTPKKENSGVINSLAISHRSGKEEIGSKRKSLFDINIPCEATDSELDNLAVEGVVVVEKKMKTESTSPRNLFDLNSCIAEEEMPCGTSLPDYNTSMKVGTGIDLEAPVILENEDVILPVEDSLVKEPEKQQLELRPDSTTDNGEAELANSAAAAIVAISLCVNNINKSSADEPSCLPTESDMDDPLHWFVDIACSSGNDVESQIVQDGRWLDDFESMTLRLKECNAEEYFPKPSIPEFPIVENSTCLLTTRTRKGQARRGRQRRDFQRDILPGLTTLSRHEVTEDLQTFGGLMRATGHPWHSGPNRRSATRNGGGRGRRRAVAAPPVPTNTVCALPLKQQQQQQHIINTEVGLEDRSLTGWGKTTRRPRRQRCPAGNPAPPVPLT